MTPSPSSCMPRGPISDRYTAAVIPHSHWVVPMKSRAVSRLSNEVRSMVDQPKPNSFVCCPDAMLTRMLGYSAT